MPFLFGRFAFRAPLWPRSSPNRGVVPSRRPPLSGAQRGSVARATRRGPRVPLRFAPVLRVGVRGRLGPSLGWAMYGFCSAHAGQFTVVASWFFWTFRHGISAGGVPTERKRVQKLECWERWQGQHPGGRCTRVFVNTSAPPGSVQEAPAVESGVWDRGGPSARCVRRSSSGFS